MPQQRWVPNGGERRVMKTRRSRRAGRGGTIEVAGFVRVTGWLEGELANQLARRGLGRLDDFVEFS
jgi:hypothetical protein